MRPTLRFAFVSLAAHAASIAWLASWSRRSARSEPAAVQWVPIEWIELAPDEPRHARDATPPSERTASPPLAMRPVPERARSVNNAAAIRARVIAPAPATSASPIEEPAPTTVAPTPSAAAPPPPPASIDVAGLFHPLSASTALTPVANGGTSREQRTQRVLTASQGYLRDLVDRDQHMQAAGTASYDTSLRRRLVEAWIPTPARDPGIVHSLAAGLVTDVDTARNVAAASTPSGPAAAATAGRAMPQAVADNRTAFTTPVTNTLAAIEALTERHTYVDIEIDQDAHGALVHACVRTPSSAAGFDRSALAAVRASVASLPARDITGGRTTRWRFEVITSRTPYVPNRPGAALGANWGASAGVGLAESAPLPTLGGSFDESTGWIQLAAPGMLHRRVRIQRLAILPLTTRTTRSDRCAP